MNTATALTTLGKTGLTVSRVQELIIAHKASIKNQAIIRLVQEFALTETDVDMLLEARGEYSAALAKMRHLLTDGFTATQVNGLYEARERINSSLGGDGDGVTIAKLLKVRDTFTAADCDADSLSEIVLAIHEAAKQNQPEISVGASINRACYIVERSGAVMLETVLDFVRTYGRAELQ